MDLRNILAGMRGSGGSRRTGANFWRKTKGSHRLRFYRYMHDGVRETLSVRVVHRTGGTPPWFDCTGGDCSVCVSWQQLRNIAILRGDPSSRAAFAKADEIRPQRKYEGIVVETEAPTGFQVLELPEGAAHKLLLIVAEEAGFIGNIPRLERNGQGSPAEEEARFTSAVTAFQAKVEAGWDLVCGPKGMDLVLTYNPDLSDKGEWYKWNALRGQQVTLEAEEGSGVPDPVEIRRRISEARARREMPAPGPDGAGPGT